MGKVSTIQQMAYGLIKGREKLFLPTRLLPAILCMKVHVYTYMYIYISGHKKVEEILLASLSCSLIPLSPCLCPDQPP